MYSSDNQMFFVLTVLFYMSGTVFSLSGMRLK